MTDYVATLNLTVNPPAQSLTLTAAGPQGTPGVIQEVLGTANQITSTLSGAGNSISTLSLPSTLVAPGSLQVTGAMEFSNAATIAAAGTTQATATVLTKDTSTVTSGTGGVVLPSGVGREITVINRTGSSINVYPPTGAAIDGAGANAATSVPSDGWITVNCVSSTQYYAIDPVTVGAANQIAITQSNNGTLTVGLATNVVIPTPSSGIGLAVAGAATGSPLQITTGATQQGLTITGAAGYSRGVLYETAGSLRWFEAVNQTAESGSNVGSDFGIFSYSDTGAYLGNPVMITRSTGGVSIQSTYSGSGASLVINNGAAGQAFNATVAGSRIAQLASTNAGGGYVAYTRSGVDKGFFGDASQLDGGTLDDFTIRATDALGLSTGGANRRVTIASTGGVTINAPTAGVALQATGMANAYAAEFIGSSTSGQSLGVIIKAGTTSADYALAVQNQAAANMLLVGGAGNVTIASPSSGPALTVNAATTGSIGITMSGNLVMSTTSSTITVASTTTAATLYLGSALLQGDGTHTYLRPNNATGDLYLGTNSVNWVSISPSGNVVHNAPSSGNALTVAGAAGSYTIEASGNSTSGSSYGLLVNAGTTSGDLALKITNQASSVTFLTVNGIGNVAINAPTSGAALTVNNVAGAASVINGANAAGGAGLSIVGNYTGSGNTALLTVSDANNTNGSNILITGNGTTTPNKYIRVASGILEVINSAYSTQILGLTDAGALSVPSTITGSSFIGAGTGLTGTAGSLTVGAAGNLAGGSTGSVPYQTGTGTTSFIAAGTNGYQLTMVSGAPAWAPSSATSATNIAGGAADSLVYQTAASTTGFIAAGTNGYVLTMVSGAPAWALAPVGTSITGTTNEIVASSSTGAVTLSLPSQVLANIQDNLQAEGSLGSGTTTIDWSQGNVVEITLTGSALTLAFTNTPSTSNSTQVMNILLYQDSTGSRTLPTFSSTIRWDSGITPVLTTTANKADILQILAVNVGGTTTYFGSQIMGNA